MENHVTSLESTIGFNSSEKPHLGLTLRGPRAPDKLRPLPNLWPELPYRLADTKLPNVLLHLCFQHK